MTYKASGFNYWVSDKNELLIVNFKKGLSSFRIVTDNDIEVVKKYISLDCCEIDPQMILNNF